MTNQRLSGHARAERASPSSDPLNQRTLALDKQINLVIQSKSFGRSTIESLLGDRGKSAAMGVKTAVSKWRSRHDSPRLYMIESQSLELLSDTQRELHHALSAFAGRQSEGLFEAYRFYTASHINCAAEGYICLRRCQRIDSSKHLIRTAIEAVIRLRAVQKKPDLLFGIAFTEFNEEKKWARSLPQQKISAAITAIEDKWIRFKRVYQAKYPKHPLVERKLSLRRIAEHGSKALESYYDSAYRLYCQFTHVALRATTGSLSNLDRHDNHTMALCVLGAVDTLADMGSPAPNIKSLQERVQRLGRSMKRKIK